MKTKYIEIMDTTLRDGEQTKGISFNLIEKLKISEKLLKEVKVDRIEIASARVSEGEKNTCKKILEWAKKNGYQKNIEILGFVDGTSNRGIDEVRALRENSKFPPTNSKYKIYIIDEVHMVTKDAFNALLKTLEEPPEYIVFLFATTEIHKLPETILSRCQKFYLNRLTDDKILEALKRIIKLEQINVDEKLLAYITNKADGSLRDAESLLDQIVSFAGKEIIYDEVIKIFGLIETELFFNFIDAILSDDYSKIFDLVYKVLIQGSDFTKFLEDLLEQFHLILLAKIIGNKLNEKRRDLKEEYVQKYIFYAEKFSIYQLRNIISELLNSINLAKYTSQIRVLVEVTLFKIIEIKNSVEVSYIINKISEFENYLRSGNISFEKEKNKRILESEKKTKENENQKDSLQILKEVFEIVKDNRILPTDLKDIKVERKDDNRIILNIISLTEFKKRIIKEIKEKIETAYSEILNQKIEIEIIDSIEEKEDIFEKMLKEKENKIPKEVSENKIVKLLLEKVGGEIIKIE